AEPVIEAEPVIDGGSHPNLEVIDGRETN
ncbi:hypothetical protein A2U01_0108181, partial [Trifolium medium]|nr:hypothetical protein [Trifolium medium]